MIKIAPLLPASQLRSEDELRSRLWKFHEGGLRSYVNANLLCCRDVWVRRSQRPHWKQTQVRRFKKGLCRRGKWLAILVKCLSILVPTLSLPSAQQSETEVCNTPPFSPKYFCFVRFLRVSRDCFIRRNLSLDRSDPAQRPKQGFG